MGIVGSKDEAGKVILGNLPPGFLDKKGLELRDTLDACLEKNMWFFSIGGLLLTIPICIKFRTERPFFVAAVTCPFADMYFGTLRCTPENEAFREHYRQLQEAYNQPVGQQQERRWQPPQQEGSGSSSSSSESDSDSSSGSSNWWRRR
uniref:Uncharacterized protein n=1 Tax=Tetradesmus obliquus TaxID=3088 RepID=A0A383VEP3_TETOB|eukprot:jgi/Sobl393_1/16217/SZX64025.1